MAVEPTRHVAPHWKLTPTGVGDARWTRGFWADRFELCRDTVLSSMWEAMHAPENAAVFSNLYSAAGTQDRRHTGTDWSDGDCYKWMEAAARVYGVTRDPAIGDRLDELIEVVAKAQEPDGYISTQIQLNPHKERWSLRRHHELYNMGHLMTAASVHHRVLGKDSFLDIARKLGDYLHDTFQPRPRELASYGFNPSNIMGLVDLYRETGDERYLELAGIFVDMRGSQPVGRAHHDGRDTPLGDLNQNRVPLREESTGVGHVVTATYLYAGAADVYAETGDRALHDALERIWDDVMTRKVYITGGAAALHHGESVRHDSVHEAYGAPYQLPNATAYNETCATIGGAMWAWRMLQATGEARYADAVERVVYNGGLAPMSLDGKRFFYSNPLRWHGRRHPLLSNDAHERWVTFTCYCCPPQVARTLAGMQDWAYGLSAARLWVHLYGSSQLDTATSHGRLRVTQETDYPWDGRVRLTMDEAPTGTFAVMLRVPGWAKGAQVRVNGGPTRVDVTPASYARVESVWSAGDVIELDLPMPVRMVVADPRVEEVKNHVAVMRGPLVYCLESTDLPDGVEVAEIHIPRNAEWRATHDADLLGGGTAIEGSACRVRLAGESEPLYRALGEEASEALGIKLIPYYAWNNRGTPDMTVWLPLC